MDDDERRARIIAEARAIIAKGITPEPEDNRTGATPFIEIEDRMTRWRNYHAQREADRQREREARAEAEREFIRQQQAAEPVRFSEHQEKILGDLVSELRHELRTDFTEQINKSSKIIDLPALPVVRRRGDAA